jgi:DNA-binding NtrC family response regulator
VSGSSDNASRATVLIVEDELLIRWAIAEHLQECGFTVLTASTAGEAIEALGTYKGQIDLVFSDVRMPGSMDGIGLAAWLKENRPGVGVILTSGDTQAHDVANELCNHVGEIVRKPYDFEALVVRIKEKLGTVRPSGKGLS